MIFNRLAIGTANFGKEYNGVKVSEDDQKQILDFCQCSGIDMIDTATAYEWDWTKVSSYFNKVVKVQKDDNLKPIKGRRPYCIMEHTDMRGRGDEIRKDCLKYGISIYERKELTFDVGSNYRYDVVQVPYSIYDRRFEEMFPLLKMRGTEIHVRSIFMRGKLLERFSPAECISFCLMNPYVDRVIIGVDSFSQLRDNLRSLHRMNSARKEENLDLRKDVK